MLFYPCNDQPKLVECPLEAGMHAGCQFQVRILFLFYPVACIHSARRADGEEEQGEDNARAQPGSRARGQRQKHEVRYEAKKTGKSKSAVKRAVKKVGVSRKKVEQELTG